MHKSVSDFGSVMKNRGWAAPRQERVRVGLALLEWLVPDGESIRHVFVDSEKEGSERSESVWAFTDTYWLNGRYDHPTWSVDISALEGSIYYLGVELEESGPIPDKAARITVEIQTDRTGYSSLYAVKEEIGDLLFLVDVYFKPNLKGVRAG